MGDSSGLTRRRLLLGATAVLGVTACDSATHRTTQPTEKTPTSTPSAAAGTTSSGPTTTGRAPGPARFVRRADGGTGVALTFHASGDVGLAQVLLDTLATHRTRVTIFGVGAWMAANPHLVARMLADGHEMANHTQTHPALGQVSKEVVASEISTCAEVLTRLTGGRSAWFRPSGIETPTKLILAEAGRAGYGTSVGYDVDTLDFQDPGTTQIVTNFRAGVTGGSIVSLHFGHRGTIDAVPALLDHLGGRGLRAVTVGELLA